MRIAISGSHATGKTTLVTELAGHLPGYAVVEEPYHALADEGHGFAALPDADAFAALLERALVDIERSLPDDVLLDRGPADYLAYLAALRPAIGSLTPWIAPVAEAMARVDLIVFVPIERPDRIGVDASEGRALRRRVDAVLREMLVEDAWGLGGRVLEVSGSPETRARQVLAAIAAEKRP